MLFKIFNFIVFINMFVYTCKYLLNEYVESPKTKFSLKFLACLSHLLSERRVNEG